MGKFLRTLNVSSLSPAQSRLFLMRIIDIPYLNITGPDCEFVNATQQQPDIADNTHTHHESQRYGVTIRQGWSASQLRLNNSGSRFMSTSQFFSIFSPIPIRYPQHTSSSRLAVHDCCNFFMSCAVLEMTFWPNFIQKLPLLHPSTCLCCFSQTGVFSAT